MGTRCRTARTGWPGSPRTRSLPGESFVYRFVAKDTGTYWYHAHQVSSEAVSRGLFGALVVLPKGSAAAEPFPTAMDVVAAVHTINGITMVGGTDLVDTRRVTPGSAVRLRLINTDSVPHRISVTGTGFAVAAVDGTDLNAPDNPGRAGASDTRRRPLRYFDRPCPPTR